MIQTRFTVLITLQFLLVVSHDWLDIPGWTHGRQVQAVLGPAKMWIGTLINSIFPGLAAGLAIYFWHRPKPGPVVNYWTIYCAVTVVSAFTMWYVPYFFGASEKTKRMYASMYAGTRHALPPCGDNPRPNLLHLCFHGLFLVNLTIALCMRL